MRYMGWSWLDLQSLPVRMYEIIDEHLQFEAQEKRRRDAEAQARAGRRRRG